LERALRLNPQDPQTIFYYGLSLEFCNEEKRAFNVYRNYDKFPRLSRYRRMEQARYDFLNRKMMRQEPSAVVLHAGICAGGCPVRGIPTATSGRWFVKLAG